MTLKLLGIEWWSRYWLGWSLFELGAVSLPLPFHSSTSVGRCQSNSVQSNEVPLSHSEHHLSSGRGKAVQRHRRAGQQQGHRAAGRQRLREPFASRFGSWHISHYTDQAASPLFHTGLFFLLHVTKSSLVISGSLSGSICIHSPGLCSLL